MTLAHAMVLIGSQVLAQTNPDLALAAEMGKAQVVRQLLAQGANPNGRDIHGNTALYLALRAEQQEAIDTLLAQPGIEVDAANDKGETPLMMAALRGNLEGAKALVRKGAKLERAGWGPLHYAASGPSTALIQWLVEQGASLQAQSPNRTTPLMMAAGYGTQDGAVLLLQLGADPKLRNDAGFNAADFARRAGRPNLALRLEQASDLAAKP